jgi:hypothetical protein
MAEENTNNNNNIANTNDLSNIPEQAKVNDEAVQTNYEALYKSGTDKALNSFIDSRITESMNIREKKVKDELRAEMQRQQRLNEEKLSESERLQVMTADEKAKYFEQKYKDTEKARARDKEVESLKTQTISMLAENGIPDIFLDVFDFGNATAEDIRQRVNLPGEYEYHPKGEFKKQLDAGIIAGINEKLKQAPPETHNGGDLRKPNGFDKLYMVNTDYGDYYEAGDGDTTLEIVNLFATQQMTKQVYDIVSQYRYNPFEIKGARRGLPGNMRRGAVRV